MKKRQLVIHYNAPVVLTFAFLSLAVLILDFFTGGATTTKFFCVYRSSFSSLLTYVRLFGHVLGHADYAHYISNIMLMLVIGTTLEDKYGSKKLLFCILVTALVSGLVQMFFFPTTALLGASGIVFMMIVLSSLSGMKTGSIPLTLILVIVLYLGGELWDAVTLRDNVSQLTHIVGGLCGAALGYLMLGKR
jgi:membrane associated rhomboid family serine protease